MKRLAVFVSPHGFGHAARVCAVLVELQQLDLELEIQILTTVPQWFFADSLAMDRVDYRSLGCDLGLVQATGLEEDLAATVLAAGEVLDFSVSRLERIIADHELNSVDAVLVDIAPLGLAIASLLGKPSILLESFTWSFIYRGYGELEPALRELAARLDPLWASVDLRIQAEPWCELAPRALQVGSIARRPMRSRASTRERLGLDGRPAVLLTMGGIGWSWDRLDRLCARSDFQFVVPGASKGFVRRENLRLLPHRSAFFHPDLMEACDLVVGKLGYSTAAEAACIGRPFLFIARPAFPESESLAAWSTAHGGLALKAGAAESLSFVDRLDFGLARRLPRVDDPWLAARQAATSILERYC